MTILARRTVHLAALAASTLLLLAFAASAHAADFVVDHTSDDTGDCNAAPTHCSFRQAFGSVASQPTDSANTITVNPGTYDISTNGVLSLTDRNVTINGGGATVTAGGNSTVFSFNTTICNSPRDVTINNLTITNGNAGEGAAGGGILSENKHLVLSRVAVKGNTAVPGNGGGIFTAVNTNPCSGPGAAGLGLATPVNSLAIDHSEISGNTAGTAGGGVFGEGGNNTPMTIDNSTISGNSAGSGGGGIQDNFMNMLLRNDTIADNHVTNSQSNCSPPSNSCPGGGVEVSDAVNSAQNLVLAKNTVAFQQVMSIHAATPPAPNNCGGAFGSTSGDYNLSDDSSCNLTGAHDQVVSDMKLHPLANYGGPTQTMEIGTDSPAFNYVPTGNCPFGDDQRAITRPQGPACDAGAFERVVTADLALTKTVSPASVTVGQTVTYTLTSTNNGPDAAANTVVTDTLPSGVAFVSDAASQGSCTGTATITCHLGTVASGAHATVTIVVRVTSVGSFLNSASVAGDPADPNTANNTATARVTGTPPPSTCVDRRKFTFKLHKFRKARIVDAVLFINGVRKAHRKGHDLKTITIARLPLGTFTVKIVSTQSTHSTLTSTRHYFGCNKGKPKTKAHHAHRHHHHG